MRTVTAKLTGTSPYSQSRYYTHAVPKKDKENAADYDMRTWRERCTVNDKGIVCIPGMGIKMAIDAAAKKLKEKVPGKGAKTWVDFVVGGIVPAELMFPIGVSKDKVDYIDVWANADGIRGSGKRVMRRFPIVLKWSAIISLDVIDNSLPTDLAERYLAEAGMIVGIGRFRPEKGGMNGRFRVSDVKWSEVEIDEAA